MPRPSLRNLLALICVAPLAAHAQKPFRPDTVRLQRVLVAEDMRGTGADGVTPLVEGVRSSDSMLRRVAVRAVGRLQRPDLARQLAAKLVDPVAAVRAEAGNAIAQSVNRVRRRASDSGQADVLWAAGVLAAAIDAERDARVADALAEALGRLPFGDSATAQMAEAAIVAHGGPGFGAIHGLYSLAVNRNVTGGLSTAAIARVRSAAILQNATTAPARARHRVPPPMAAAVRRVAVMTLGLVNGLDSATVFSASRDPDEQVRRLVLGGLRQFTPAARAVIMQQAFGDPSPIVRIGAIIAARTGVQRADCAPIVAATSDTNTYVSLMAIDALGLPCVDSAGVSQALTGFLDQSGDLHRDGSTQRLAHALVALAHLGLSPAAMLGASPDWLVHMYVARAAAVVKDTALLRRLAADPDHNVREAAITGLAAVSKHAADSIFIANLASPGYQVVLASADALAGTQDPTALDQLLDAFDRLSAQRRENSRDPRMALLKRLSEAGSSSNVTRLQRYLVDYDSTIATTVSGMLSKWAGTAADAHPMPLPVRQEPLARLFLGRNIRLKVTMARSSGGGTFIIRLFTNEAPATAARIIRLARAHYYDGHVFQRVEPNFVIQGGGPDANEYVGDAAFMRDELAWRSHLRGTLGISSRGRDTGDAQWFFNLTDNTRLDHEYTVFGEVTAGLNVVERILEGDVIARVEVLGASQK
jgi:cyclophilin family peptidyl-prolyl cis-trans isomerase/HEAT repeat protein